MELGRFSEINELDPAPMRGGKKWNRSSRQCGAGDGKKIYINMDEKNYDDDVRLDWWDDEPVEQPKDDEVLDSYYDFG